MTTTTTTGQVGAAYASCRARIGELVRAAGDERATATVVPACPGWSVHHVVAHLAGVVADALAGNLEGVATDPWTAAQVDARRGRTVDEIVDEWDAAAPAFEAFLDAIGDPGRQAVLDAVTHEHDIRGALGRPGGREADAVRIGLGFIGPRFVEAAGERGVQVRVVSDHGHVYGREDAPLTLSGSPFDLVRALTGRRSPDQLRAMAWDGDASDAVIAAFTYGPFTPATSPIEE
jgi:uncharacterized protein (TIGR03083 family)